MKKLLIGLLVLGCAAGQTLTQPERDKAIQHLS